MLVAATTLHNSMTSLFEGHRSISKQVFHASVARNQKEEEKDVLTKTNPHIIVLWEAVNREPG